MGFLRWDQDFLLRLMMFEFFSKLSFNKEGLSVPDKDCLGMKEDGSKKKKRPLEGQRQLSRGSRIKGRFS